MSTRARSMPAARRTSSSVASPHTEGPSTVAIRAADESMTTTSAWLVRRERAMARPTRPQPHTTTWPCIPLICRCILRLPNSSAR